MSERRGFGRRIANRLPRGLRSLARLATVNTRLDKTIENQKKLVERMRRQNKRMADVLGAVDRQNARLEALEARMAGEMETSRLRPEALEAHFPQPRASEAPVGRPKMSDEEVQAEISKVEHWYHRIQVAPGIFTPGINESDMALEAMEVPGRLDGMRLLDVGARDGYFSFVAEARGAEVLAIDALAPHLTGFSTAASLMGSSVEYRTMNVYDVTREEIGTFDAIFFLGVLYHLRDPMLALDRLWGVAKPGATIWVESHTIDHGLVDPASGQRRSLASVAPELAEVPMAQFYPKDPIGGDFTNWWGPNLAGLKAMVESAGFEVTRSRLVGVRGLVVGRKREDEQTDFYRRYDRSVMT